MGEFTKSEMPEMIKVRLTTVADVQEFVRVANTIPVDVSARSEKYCINCKSIMAVLSINLSNPFWVEIAGEYTSAFERWFVLNECHNT